MQAKAALILISSFMLFSAMKANAVTVIPSDYIIAGTIGDSWDYERLDGSQFTWTLSNVTTGPNTGRFERGNNDSGMIYGLAGNDLSIYELEKNPLIPPVVIGESELGQVFTYPDDPVNPTMYLFLKVPSITVQAGTFNDVLAWIFLDGTLSANPANTRLGLDPLITAAVTDINIFALGIGEVAFVGVDALTGESDGTGHELIRTSVIPIPGAFLLFGTALIGLFKINRQGKAA